MVYLQYSKYGAPKEAQLALINCTLNDASRRSRQDCASVVRIFVTLEFVDVGLRAAEEIHRSRCGRAGGAGRKKRVGGRVATHGGCQSTPCRQK